MPAKKRTLSLEERLSARIETARKRLAKLEGGESRDASAQRLTRKKLKRAQRRLRRAKAPATPAKKAS